MTADKWKGIGLGDEVILKFVTEGKETALAVRVRDVTQTTILLQNVDTGLYLRLTENNFKDYEVIETLWKETKYIQTQWTDEEKTNFMIPDD